MDGFLWIKYDFSVNAFISNKIVKHKHLKTTFQQMIFFFYFKGWNQTQKNESKWKICGTGAHENLQWSRCWFHKARTQSLPHSNGQHSIKGILNFWDSTFKHFITYTKVLKFTIFQIFINRL